MLTFLREYLSNRRELFLLFSIARKLKLLNFVLHFDRGLQMDAELFTECLVNDAYDVAVLLLREFGKGL